MRTKLGQNVEELLERDNIVGKLDQLREITSKTQQPPGHQAWRPNGNPDDAMAALDLQVAERELEELSEEALAKSVEKLEEINLRLATFSN